MKTAGEFMVECLETEGVKYVFGIPGEENLEIIHALYESKKIKFILVRHEQGAAFMADVYGRLTNHAGVCLATLGPGATNLITGVADANSDGSPLVAITGQVGTDRMHLTSHQYLDLSQIYAPITKRTKFVMLPGTVNEIVRLAFKYAEGGRMGATHIDLPVNISKMSVPDTETPLKKDIAPYEEAEERDVLLAAQLLGEAKRPLILAGNHAVKYASSEVVTAFADKTLIPVVNTMMAKGIVPCDDPLSMMTIGIPQKDYVNLLFDQADLVIAVGYDIMELMPQKWNADRHLKIIHVSNRPADINKFYQCDAQIVGSIDSSLFRIMKYATSAPRPEWAMKIKQAFLRSAGALAGDDSFPMKPQRIIADVRRALGREDVLVSDVGAHKMWIGRLYECYRPNTCIVSNGFASMGIGVPGAIAAKLVYPEKNVLTITGDGGFLMNSQELETAVRLGLNFVVLIFNDSYYGLIKWKQQDQYGREMYTGFTNPDFVKYAEAMRCIGVKIEKAADLLPAIQKGFQEKVPVVIDVAVDYSENEKLSAELRGLD
jgi:acetolactate synthase-1/2/3 large subunit